MSKWTDDDMRSAVKNSRSIRQALQSLGLKPAGGNYKTVKDAIARLGLDDSHFGGQSWTKGQNLGPRRPLEDYLSNRVSITSHKLRLRLLEEGVFERKCYGGYDVMDTERGTIRRVECGLTEWMGEPVPLELEHINGDHNDNSLKNLTLLCANCHALTPTYRRRKNPDGYTVMGNVMGEKGKICPRCSSSVELDAEGQPVLVFVMCERCHPDMNK